MGITRLILLILSSHLQAKCLYGYHHANLTYFEFIPSVYVYLWVSPRAGHVPTFFKLFRSALERGPLAKSFRSRSFCFFIVQAMCIYGYHQANLTYFEFIPSGKVSVRVSPR